MRYYYSCIKKMISIIDFYIVFTYSLRRKNNFILLVQLSFRSYLSSFIRNFPLCKKNNRTIIQECVKSSKRDDKYSLFFFSFSKYFKTRDTKFHKTSRLPCTSSISSDHGNFFKLVVDFDILYIFPFACRLSRYLGYGLASQMIRSRPSSFSYKLIALLRSSSSSS